MPTLAATALADAYRPLPCHFRLISLPRHAAGFSDMPPPPYRIFAMPAAVRYAIAMRHYATPRQSRRHATPPAAYAVIACRRLIIFADTSPPH